MGRLSRLALRAVLYFRGVRFYESNSPPCGVKFMTKSYKTLKGYEIKFHCHRETVDDHIFKRGKVRHHRFVGYTVQADFPSEFPEELRQLNNLKFFFPKRGMALFSERVLVDSLMVMFVNLLQERHIASQQVG